jgi:hypothetical protein
MGLFKKKQDENKKYTMEDNSDAPQLPDLPKLPDFPGMEEPQNIPTKNKSQLPQLPSFPNNSLGNKFSQNTIKEAVAGEKEVDSEGDANEFTSEMPKAERKMRKPLEGMQRGIMSRTREEPEDNYYEESYERRPSYSRRQYSAPKKEGPVFIRLDNFEESMKIFHETKEQISDIEHLLKDIKELKKKEEEELDSWEDEIQEIKNQIEKVDEDIFSKI